MVDVKTLQGSGNLLSFSFFFFFFNKVMMIGKHISISEGRVRTFLSRFFMHSNFNLTFDYSQDFSIIIPSVNITLELIILKKKSSKRVYVYVCVWGVCVLMIKYFVVNSY